MKFITVSELRAQATRIISEIESSKEEVVITKKGHPVVLMRAVHEGEFGIKSATKGRSHGKSKGPL